MAGLAGGARGVEGAHAVDVGIPGDEGQNARVTRMAQKAIGAHLWVDCEEASREGAENVLEG